MPRGSVRKVRIPIRVSRHDTRIAPKRLRGNERRSCAQNRLREGTGTGTSHGSGTWCCIAWGYSSMLRRNQGVEREGAHDRALTSIRVRQYGGRRVMAGEVSKPHDHLFRTVFGEKAEAAGLLRAHLPAAVSRELVWSSLRWQSVSFIDDRLRDSESDLLYADRAQGRRRTGVAVRAGARPDQGGAGRHPRRAARSHRATGDDGGVPGELAAVAAAGGAARDDDDAHRN